MQLENILPFAHSLLKQALKPDARALDGTAGNGNDTLMLARSIGSGGKVWAFDVQEQALANTRMRLEEAGIADRAELILDGHENLAAHIREPLDAAVFNFGWLP
ncbi:MAG: methyltransferase domain-containing protein, partial [Neisseria sp.]